MKKLVLVLILVAAFSASPAMAGFESCDRAAQYGWHSGWANMICFYDIMNDIFNVDLVSTNLDDLVGGDTESITVHKKGDAKVKVRR